MKTIFLFLALFSTSAIANPALSPGDRFFSSISVLQQKTIEKIDVRSEAGKQRWRELQALERECLYKNSSLVECSWFVEIPQVPSDRMTELQRKYGDQLLSVGAFSSSTLINDGESLQEWQVVQPVKWQGQEFSEFRWQKTQGTQKIILGNKPQAHYFNIYANRISLPLIERVEESRWISHLYLLEIDFINLKR